MAETLLSVGIDIGTSTTQLVISRLTLENRANPFSVPKVAIAEREVLYRSDIHFTPLLSDTVIDAQGVRAIVEEEYRKSGFDKGEIATGAVIITGETARKENAREVLSALSAFAGDFVVATAGHLEHVGRGLAPAAPYRTPVVGDTAAPEALAPVIQTMVEALEQAAGLRPGRERMDAFLTQGTRWEPRAVPVVSFSGGVADCIDNPPADWRAYGDIGVLLGRAIAASQAFQQAGRFRGAETIRATVVGAGSHATDLSGSTIFYRDMTFPLKNLPILKLTAAEEQGDAAALAQSIRDKLGWFADEGGLSQLVLALRGEDNPSYARIQALARGVADGLAPLRAAGFVPIVAVECDQAKVLGQALAPLVDGPLLCLDGVGVDSGDYLDIGAPVAGGTVLPVVIKTLAFQKS